MAQGNCSSSSVAQRYQKAGHPLGDAHSALPSARLELHRCGPLRTLHLAPSGETRKP